VHFGLAVYRYMERMGMEMTVKRSPSKCVPGSVRQALMTVHRRSAGGNAVYIYGLYLLYVFFIPNIHHNSPTSARLTGRSSLVIPLPTTTTSLGFPKLSRNNVWKAPNDSERCVSYPVYAGM